MLPHYLWKVKVHICSTMRTMQIDVEGPAMVFTGISKVGLNDLIFVDPAV